MKDASPFLPGSGGNQAAGKEALNLGDRQIINIAPVLHQKTLKTQCAALKGTLHGDHELDYIDGIEFQISDKTGFLRNPDVQTPVLDKFRQRSAQKLSNIIPCQITLLANLRNPP